MDRIEELKNMEDGSWVSFKWTAKHIAIAASKATALKTLMAMSAEDLEKASWTPLDLSEIR